MKHRYLIAGVLAGLVLLAPAAWNVYASVRLHDWRSSVRHDGLAYAVSDSTFVALEADETGIAASIATLLSWNGTDASELDVLGRFSAQGTPESLADVNSLADDFGLAGQWLAAEPGALERLKVPFLAHVSDGGGRVVIVRNVRGGYVYATDPARGNVLYPLEQFTAVWTGQVFAFPDPPGQPEEWR